MKKIAILGSSGSIGQSTLKVVRNLSHCIEVVALAVHSDIEALEAQINEFHPKIVAVFDEKKAKILSERVGNKTKIVAGLAGIAEVASYSEIEFVVMAIVGMDALAPTLAAINAGKSIGLANKEVLVAAGDIVTNLAKQKKVNLLPIDSEHSALFQCLQSGHVSEVNRLILTASGGPFRNFSDQQLDEVRVEDALNHPNWSMGPKVTIDSSTLMNKGLEMIEAHQLFGLDSQKIEVIIHPQSLIHSLVEFVDGSMIAQMSVPDMVLPIQYALTYPLRKHGILKPFDFTKHPRLDFVAPDFKKFPALELAYSAIREGGSLPCFMNACNEILVHRFLKKEISWKGIIHKLSHLMEDHKIGAPKNLDDLISIDQEARAKAFAI